MTPEDRKWFRVEVSDHDGQIVSIEPGMLAGRNIGENEEAKVREAIEHLMGFIGNEGRTCWLHGREIDPDCTYCPSPYSELETVALCECPPDCQGPDNTSAQCRAENRGVNHDV